VIDKFYRLLIRNCCFYPLAVADADMQWSWSTWQSYIVWVGFWTLEAWTSEVCASRRRC